MGFIPIEAYAIVFQVAIPCLWHKKMGLWKAKITHLWGIVDYMHLQEDICDNPPLAHLTKLSQN